MCRNRARVKLRNCMIEGMQQAQVPIYIIKWWPSGMAGTEGDRSRLMLPCARIHDTAAACHPNSLADSQPRTSVEWRNHRTAQTRRCSRSRNGADEDHTHVKPSAKRRNRKLRRRKLGAHHPAPWPTLSLGESVCGAGRLRVVGWGDCDDELATHTNRPNLGTALWSRTEGCELVAACSAMMRNGPLPARHVRQRPRPARRGIALDGSRRLRAVRHHKCGATIPEVAGKINARALCVILEDRRACCTPPRACQSRRGGLKALCIPNPPPQHPRRPIAPPLHLALPRRPHRRASRAALSRCSNLGPSSYLCEQLRCNLTGALRMGASRKRERLTVGRSNGFEWGRLSRRKSGAIVAENFPPAQGR